MTQTPTHIIIISNRGPFTFSYRDNVLKTQRGSGGLVTAISTVARDYNITWISCALTKGDRQWLEQMGPGVHNVGGMSLKLVVPNPTQYQAYYNVISNPILWFVQHQMYDTPRAPIFDDATWHAWNIGYARINQQLAEVAAEVVAGLEGNIIIMPQDYHLYLLPRYLRELIGNRGVIQSFLHIPWPGPDAWRVLPSRMRIELIEAMLHTDRLGFQTERDTRRFLQTCAEVLPDAQVSQPWRQLSYQGRTTEAAPYPISVDTESLEKRLASKAVQSHVERFRALYKGTKLLLRIDRVDPSKNILRGFIAFRNFLNAYPEYIGKIEMLALLVPSRTEVAEYKQYLRDIMTLVGEINATLGDSDWEPIRVLLGNNYDRALAALSLYDILLVNPLADGMNLVAKEGALLNQQDGVLILSEEAGTAEEFGDAPIRISPYDVFDTREAIYHALLMPADERHARAEKLRSQVREHTIHRWFARQLADAQSTLSSKITTLKAPDS